MLILYNILINIFSIFAKIYLRVRIKKNKEHPKRYLEKLSVIDLPKNTNRLVWFHVASVGEFLSIVPIIDQFLKDRLFEKILVTSITLSSSEIFDRKYKKNNNIIHQFLPIDKSKFIKTFLKHWSPSIVILVESEIWPNLIFEVKKTNIPLILLNARITSKTFAKWIFIKGFAKKIFQQFDLCLSSNKETNFFLEKLGVKKIKNFGNLKFSSNLKIAPNSENINLGKKNKVWCAISTHDPEEIVCANSHLKLKSNYDNLLGIVIPRHISRVNSIEESLLNMNLKVQLVSQSTVVKDKTDILIVDTYGEVAKYLSLSNLAFLGGSLINHGGQNPIEAVKLGCKVSHGPNVQNFKEIYEYLSNMKLSNLVNDETELYDFFKTNLDIQASNKENIIKQINQHGENILTKTILEIKNQFSI